MSKRKERNRTRPLIHVTAIDKNGELHKWSFRGEPDWKRIEKEVLEVGVAAVIEGACAYKGHRAYNSTALWAKELGDGKSDGFPEWICGLGLNHPDMPGCISTFGSTSSLATLRARIKEVYGEPEPETIEITQKWVFAGKPEPEPMNMTIDGKKMKMYANEHRCSDCAHPFTPKRLPATLLVDKLEELCRPVMQYLCENYHPHVCVIITPTDAQLMEDVCSTGDIFDYVKD